MKQKMTSRERLKRCYFNEELDRPAVYSRTAYPDDDPSYDRLKRFLGTHTELKHYWDTAFLEAPCPSDCYTEPYSDDFERKVTTLHTPAGDLESSTLKGLKGQPGLHEKFFLRTRNDAEKFLSLPLPVVGGDVSGYFSADREMADRGIIDVSLGMNPAGFVVELFGSETFAMITADERDIVHALCERRMKTMMNRLRFLLDQGVGPYFSMLGEEYIVPPLHGPTDFHDFNVKYDKAIVDLLHDAGGRIHIHCHGAVKKVFQGFIEIGADVLHPFEAPPMGDITPTEAKEMARGKLCLEGNIQIAAMYESDPEDVRNETRALIEAAFDDHRGLIVCPTASPYLYGKGEACFEQYKAMVEAVLEVKVIRHGSDYLQSQHGL